MVSLARLKNKREELTKLPSFRGWENHKDGSIILSWMSRPLTNKQQCYNLKVLEPKEKIWEGDEKKIELNF